MSTAASAGDLVYQPLSPTFGGSPLNSSHILSTANAQKSATASDADDDLLSGSGLGDNNTASSDQAALFVRQLESRLLSSLASQVTDAIFGDNPQDSGTVQFGDTSVSFERTLDSLQLTIINGLDGSVTEITVPQLVTSN
tara:strand:+ start:162 stop:581 length:420 start_codon:yes stop_codon:yes gene_type:complete